MIRLRRLVLHDVRNVAHGTLTFNDLESGGSITGIYGQNGSGKTAVIDCIVLLRSLMSGDPLPADAADIINAVSGQSTITALIEIRGKTTQWVEYEVTLQMDTARETVRIVGESIRMSEDPAKMGRPVVSHETSMSPDIAFDGYPGYVWKSLRATPVKSTLQRSEEMAYTQNRSLLFAHSANVGGWDKTSWLIPMMVGHAAQASARTRSYVDERLSPLAKTIPLLADWAENHILISTTRRSGYASYQMMPIAEERNHGRNVERLVDLIQPNIVTPRQAEWLKNSIATFDKILPNIIPGLHIKAKTTPMPSGDNGEDRVSIELMSVRGNEIIPFRCESEGVVRITALLGYLVHVYNDPSTLVAVDEFDSGIYEYLLGDLLKQLADGLSGQLIFTAHNLHAMEVLPEGCVRSTTTDANKRFIRFSRRTGTTGIRHRYLTAADLGWDGPEVYDAPLPRMFGNSLYLAGHPKTDEENRAIRERLNVLAGRR